MHDMETIMSVNWIAKKKKKIVISNVKMVDNEEISELIWNEDGQLGVAPNITFPYLLDRTPLHPRL